MWQGFDTGMKFDIMWGILFLISESSHWQGFQGHCPRTFAVKGFNLPCFKVYECRIFLIIHNYCTDCIKVRKAIKRFPHLFIALFLSSPEKFFIYAS